MLIYPRVQNTMQSRYLVVRIVRIVFRAIGGSEDYMRHDGMDVWRGVEFTLQGVVGFVCRDRFCMAFSRFRGGTWHTGKL